MKKVLSLAFAAAALVAVSANAQEVTYVEDCSQGILINKATDNWYLTAEGGANVLVSHHDVRTNKFLNRIGAQAGLYVGKWVTPNFGFRFGAHWQQPKGATTEFGEFRKLTANQWSNGYYPETMMSFGPEVAMTINLTNWWCGYKPNRVYNSDVIFGGGFYFNTFRNVNAEGKGQWKNAHDTQLFVFAAWQNNFRLCKNVDFFLEPRAEMVDFGDAVGVFSLNAGFTFKFNETEWNCPLTAVCPTWKYTDAEGDALVARLNAANNQVRNLQNQLDECLKSPKTTVRTKNTGTNTTEYNNDCEGLVTVYYPINSSTLSAREKTVLKSVASVMKSNPDVTYVLTGWADNYTGSESVNVRLRNARVDGVKKYLVSCGVPADQLEATIDNGNLTDYGQNSAPLDRAVTIREK